jgi:iron complex outermembrane recepter protein
MTNDATECHSLTGGHMSVQVKKNLGVAIAIIIASACAQVAVAQAQDSKVVSEIPTQSLAETLKALGAQTNTNILADPRLIDGKQAPPIKADLSVDQAMSELLEGTGLTYKFLNERTIVLASNNRTTSLARDQGVMRLAQNDTQASSNPPDEASAEPSAEVATTGDDSPNLEEVVVTGSHIRGTKASASPVLRFQREDIKRTGYSTLDQFVESLPQNFGGGASQDTVGTDSSVGNNAYGNGVNLRALGPGASLVLLNGRRLAPGGNSGRFVDISMIPLSAVERVEVLTDGASAIYGADAVGGVVNLILKKDYEGAETALRYGSVTEGGSKEMQAAQALGTNWNGGGGLLTYEYNHRDALDARDRDFASGSDTPRTLLPEQTRHSVYASAHQSLSSNISLFADLLYSRRDIENVLSYFSLRNDEKAKSKQIHGALGADIELNDNWHAQLSTSYSQYKFDASFLRTPLPTGPGDLTFSNVDTDTWSFDAMTDGTLMTLPGGALRLAVGASHRKENVLPIGGDTIPERHVNAAFGELFIPLVGESNRRSGVEALELSVAARYEDYNDFGSDVTPKIGLRWAPSGGLNLRATYGESFKAPTMSDLAPGNETLLAFVASDFGLALAGDPLILLRAQAARPQLHEEKSKSWTAGFDFQREDGALSLGLTYFNIEFEGRVDSPLTGGFDAFFNSPEIYGDFMVLNPDAGFVTARLADATQFTDLTGGAFAPDAVGIWADVAPTNIAAESQSGLDVTIAYPFETRLGRFDASLNSTFLLDFEKKVAPRAPARDVLNLLNEPIDLRLRAALGWSKNNLSASLFANYQDSYETASVPAISIASWTTFDAQARYAFPEQGTHEFVSGVDLMLSVQNLLDKDPPFVVSQGSPIAHSGFDSVNATPLGRFVSVELTKSW